MTGPVPQETASASPQAPAPAPRLGCGALILRGDAILLVHRRRAPEAGHWGIPGGKVDWLEPVPRAVEREIAEETGLRIAARDLLCVVDQIDAHGGTHWVAPIYLVPEVSGEAVLREPEALAALGWFPRDALPQPLTLATRTALAAFAARG
ncbi:NUDIX domain-containing protein [Sphingomonas morindae]|uniref:NUDIX domain-containing protein n=1 Tax=Sphingomonas morindae TaxID=1541170 RepID=A0ABY4XC63_9SPHN|nr:NUDIX domain-containing protein [Sphingomonas morindae]USI74331.1 NUDIX domain-containing protein [Sphingomonas morindae]